MKTKLTQAAVCIIFLTMTPAAYAQLGFEDSRPKIDSSRMDKYIKSYQDAVKYYQKGQLNLAEKELTEFLDKVGEHAGGNFLMGMVQAQQGDLEKARTSFRTTVRLDPKMVAPHGWLGAVEAVLGNPSGAAAQKAALEQMKAECAGTCPKAAEIAEGIQRIDENIAAAAAPPARPS